MRRLTLTLVAAGVALAAATPAAAQYYPNHQRGYAYGHNNYGQWRSMKARIDGIQRQVDNLRSHRLISRDEANGLRHEANRAEERLMRASRYGLNGWEARELEQRIANLERHVVREVRDGRTYDWRNGYRGYGQSYAYRDRDRDGRDDRYEDDRGNRHDHH